MKTGFLVVGRMKSVRLPKKLTLQLLEKEVIRWMIDRLKLAPGVDEIVIATSGNPQDDVLCDIADDMGIKYFRGSEEDVLERLYRAAEAFDLDYIVNITADCPLVAYDYIQEMLEIYKKDNYDLITSFKLPHGFYFYGIKPAALKKVIEIKDSNATEVWGKYFTETGLFKVHDMDTPEHFVRADYRLTLDYPEDFQLLEAIFNHFGQDTYKTKMEDIIQFLDDNPEIVKINQDCREKYQQRWDKQSDINLKQ